MPGWIEEFEPHYEVPGVIPFLVRKKVIKDLSWHNDTAPSFGLMSGDGNKIARIWVGHPLFSRRELGGKRYIVSYEDNSDRETENTEFDELEEALGKLFEYLADISRDIPRGVKEWRPNDDSLSSDVWDDPADYLRELTDEYLSDPRA